MLRRSQWFLGVRLLSGSHTTELQVPSIVLQRRYVGVDMLQKIAKKSVRDAISLETNHSKIAENRTLMEQLTAVQNHDKVEYRRRPNPWEIVPKYAKRRVSDMVGILTSEHRMEIEQVIEDMQTIADVECYVVIVPTVGYVSPQTFAQSIFWNWAIGEPRGNGLLLLIAQQEGAVQLIASQAIAEYYHQRFIEGVVAEIFQPLVKEGSASYAVVQTVYAVARQGQEMRHLWQGGLLPLPVRNKVRFSARVLVHGLTRTWSLYWAVVLTVLSAILWNQLLDGMCPRCGQWMHRVIKPEQIWQNLDSGQRIEYEDACTSFRVFRCPKCPEGKRVIVYARDFHFNDKCLKCQECNYNTVRLTTTVEKLPTKEEDGRKRQQYACQNCRVARDIVLPLFRPLESEPEGEWYDFLLNQAKEPKSFSQQKLAKPVDMEG